MTSDPARHLADVGGRLLRTMRPFFEVPVALQLPDAYGGALLDPITVLSGVCDELLGARTPPAATEEDGAPVATVRFSMPHTSGRAEATSTSSFSQEVSRAEAPGTFPPAPRSGAPAPAPRQGAGTMRASSAVPTSLAGPVEMPDASVPRQEDTAPPETEPREFPQPETSGQGPRQESPEWWITQRDDGAPWERSAADLPTRDGHPPARPGEPPDARSAASGATYGPAQQEPWDPSRLEVSIGDPRLGADPAREDLERDAPGPVRTGAVRLSSDSARLAAMLRAHAAHSPEKPWEEASSSPSPAEDGEKRREPADDRIGVEEVVERLADELETAFVRTYGSSGV